MSKSRYINPAEEIKHTGPYIAQCKWADRTGPQNFFLGGGARLHAVVSVFNI
jgi:hypothetical protein